MRFAKYSGAGNDFVVCRPDAAGADPRHAARAACQRRTGVGADGLILVGTESEGLIRVRFFNPDGGEFSTCGNGSRCAARFAVDEQMVPGPDLRLVTAAGPIAARVEKADVRLRYRLPARVRTVAVEWEGSPVTAWLSEVGVPHLVIRVDDLPGGPIEDACAPLRFHSALGPQGANVNLVRRDDGSHLTIRTFERGVESETLACGSGCMAAALALHEAGAVRSEVELRVRSGDRLEVRVGGEGPEGRELWLAGPAVRVFEGVFPLDADG